MTFLDMVLQALSPWDDFSAEATYLRLLILPFLPDEGVFQHLVLFHSFTVALFTEKDLTRAIYENTFQSIIDN
ncbi:hypothetical protein ES703_46378 [subsurface metagenome]